MIFAMLQSTGNDTVYLLAKWIFAGALACLLVAIAIGGIVALDALLAVLHHAVAAVRSRWAIRRRLRGIGR